MDEVHFLLRLIRNKLKQIHLYTFQYKIGGIGGFTTPVVTTGWFGAVE